MGLGFSNLSANIDLPELDPILAGPERLSAPHHMRATRLSAARGRHGPPGGPGLPPRVRRGEGPEPGPGFAGRRAGRGAGQLLPGHGIRPLLGGATGRAGPAARTPARLARLRGLRGGRRRASRPRPSRNAAGRGAHFRRGTGRRAGAPLRGRPRAPQAGRACTESRPCSYAPANRSPCQTASIATRTPPRKVLRGPLGGELLTWAKSEAEARGVRVTEIGLGDAELLG